MSRLNRLLTMNTRELVYRVHERIRSESERFRHFAGGGTATSNVNCDHFKDYLSQVAEPHFYLRAEGVDRERRLDAIRRTYPAWIDETITEADLACRHRVRLLGLAEIDLGAVIDWHRDPVTAKSWPRRFWSDYDLVNDCGAGDPKVIHELNRHQHILALAKAYFLLRDERYSLEAVAQLESWIEQNPPSTGIHWQSSLEIAIRAVSWVWTLFLLLPSKALTPESASRIGRSLFAQFDHIERFPSIFSSPNTHLIGEATALYIAGTVFQGVEQSGRWQRRGSSWLMSQMDLQVKPDGVHGELSSYYHCYTVDFLMQALTLSRLNGFEFPQSMWTRLDQMREFLRHFERNDGTLPLVGDDDGGRALAIVAKDYRRSRFDEEMFWLCGENRVGTTPAATHALYPASGYAIQRSGWGPDDSQLIFDCGGMGILNGGHGHADALSIVLSVGGTPILTDPGTFVYNGAPEWRDFFRSARAHNVVVVDGADPSIPGGTFKWNKRANCQVKRHLSHGGFDYVEGEHDGYSEEPVNITHGRSILHVREGVWVVVDDLSGPPADHQFDFFFHFPPQARLSVQQESGSVLRINAGVDSARLQLLMCGSAEVQATAIEGQQDPVQGWVSAIYGEKAPAPALRLRMQAAAPASGMFILAPSRSGADPAHAVAIRSIAVKDGVALACEAEHGDFRDTFVSSLADQEVVVQEFTLRGKLFWLRSINGRLTRMLGIDCKEIRHRGEIHLQDEAGRSHFEKIL